MKTFSGILLCYLDAPAIIKRNDIQLHDYSWIVKYADFYILLLLLLLLAQVMYNQAQPMRINYLASWFLHKFEPQTYKFNHNIKKPHETDYINIIVQLYN